MSQKWHKVAITAAMSFMEDVPVNLAIVSAHKKVVEENTKIVEKNHFDHNTFWYARFALKW